MTWRGSKGFADDATGVIARLLGGLVRRMSVTLSDSTLWQVLGQRDGVGGDETIDVENFSGIGFYARPPTSGKPEVVTVAVGGAKVTVVVATRDEATRAAMAGGVNEDETAVFNSSVMILVKADGTIEIGSGIGMESTIMADTYRTAEDTLFAAMIDAYDGAWSALNTYAAAIQPVADPATIPAPHGPATTTMLTASTALITDLGVAQATFEAAASAYKTTIAKVR